MLSACCSHTPQNPQELDSETSDVDLVLLDGMRPYGGGTPITCINRESSSMDVPMMGNEPGMYPAYYDVRKVADALRASGHFRNVRHVFANVSIVKFVDKATGIEGDININERFGLHNSLMIKSYCDLRPRLVRPLIFFVKQWAKMRELNDPSGSKGPASFSSYTLALM